MIDDEDLFAVRAKVQRRPAKAKPETMPVGVKRETGAESCVIRQPSGLVASFSCVCGAQDEVREPAPETVACWSCKTRRMKRWASHDTPFVSARQATAEERALSGQPE